MRQLELAPSSTNRHAEVWEFPIPGGLVLAVPDLDGLFLLNPSAAFIWAESRRGSSPPQIAARLSSVFDISEDVASRDVSAAINQWADALFAERPGRGASPGPSPQPTASQHFDYTLNGKHFRIVLDSAELTAEIAPRLAHLATHDAPPDFILRLITEAGSIRLLHGSCCFGTEESVSAARAILLQEIVRLSQGECAWLALLHAGACGSDSACVVFPAATHSGKTTLSAVLMQSGFAFYSDDSVAIGKDTLCIPPMPFGLAVREGSWPVLAARFPEFDALPAMERFGQRVRFLPPSPPAAPVRAIALVFPLYRSASATFVTTLDTLDTLIHLKESGFWVEHTRQSIATFLAWVQSLPSHRVVYSDVEDAVSFFRQVLADHSC